jgi:hypothetical protein
MEVLPTDVDGVHFPDLVAEVVHGNIERAPAHELLLGHDLDTSLLPFFTILKKTWSDKNLIKK